MLSEETLKEFGLTRDLTGGNKLCVIQTKVNRRRLRKRGKKHKKRKLPKKEVLKSIFQDYKLVDHIAPAEIDPYWQTMYVLYSYTVYLLKYIKEIIKDDMLILNDENGEIIDIYYNLTKIEEQLFNYLCGYFEILVRLTFSKRFWGWRFYYESIFYPEFWELCISLLRDLSYDFDKAKPSVYFINACWFRGLQLGNEIINKLKTEKECFIDTNRGLLKFEEEEVGILNDISFDDIYTDGTDSEICFNLLYKFSGTDKLPVKEDIINENIEDLNPISLMDRDPFEIIDEYLTNNIIHSILLKLKKYFNVENNNDLLNEIIINKIKSNIDKIINELNLTSEELEYLKNIIE